MNLRSSLKLPLDGILTSQLTQLPPSTPLGFYHRRLSQGFLFRFRTSLENERKVVAMVETGGKVKMKTDNSIHNVAVNT